MSKSKRQRRIESKNRAAEQKMIRIIGIVVVVALILLFLMFNS